MWIGFQDDPTFRWRDDRANMLDEAVDANAGIVRTTVYWSRNSPAASLENPANPFDSAYRFDDLDRVRARRTVPGPGDTADDLGHPELGERQQGHFFAPTRMSDITAFARALASRYSGRYPGFPYVRFFSVWNEPNGQQFLAPTYNSKGKPVSPFTYAKLYRAAYSGLQAMSQGAQVGAGGQRPPRGRDRPSPEPVQDWIERRDIRAPLVDLEAEDQVRRLHAPPVLGSRPRARSGRAITRTSI